MRSECTTYAKLFVAESALTAPTVPLTFIFRRQRASVRSDSSRHFTSASSAPAAPLCLCRVLYSAGRTRTGRPVAWTPSRPVPSELTLGVSGLGRRPGLKGENQHYPRHDAVRRRIETRCIFLLIFTCRLKYLLRTDIASDPLYRILCVIGSLTYKSVCFPFENHSFVSPVFRGVKGQLINNLLARSLAVIHIARVSS